jgi:hypothetical protein
MGSVESWRRAALAAYVLAGAGLASGGYALATTQANVNAIAAAQKRLDDDEWSKHQAHARPTAPAAPPAKAWRWTPALPCRRRLVGRGRPGDAVRCHGGRHRARQGRRQP